MSLLREKTGNVSQFSNSVVINALNAGAILADSADVGGFGVGVVTIPAETPDNTVIPFQSLTATAVVSLAAADITIQFDPYYLYEGKVLFGAQSGPGTVAFDQNEGTEVTIYDVTGRVVPLNQPTVFMGGYGVMVCTERTPTTATLRTISGNFGSTSLIIIPSSQTTPVTLQAGVKNVVSQTTSSVDFVFNPVSCCPFGSTLTLTQTGSGQLNLVAADDTTVTFVDQFGAEVTSPVIDTGMTCQYVSIAHNATSVTLQQVFCSSQSPP